MLLTQNHIQPHEKEVPPNPYNNPLRLPKALLTQVPYFTFRSITFLLLFSSLFTSLGFLLSTLLHPSPSVTWPPQITLSTSVTFLTAKFGHASAFRLQVLEHCKYTVAWLRPQDNARCYYDFPQYILEDKRFKQHLRFLNDPNDDSKRGGGYWFWKPFILNQTMIEIPEDTLIAFSDVDEPNIFNQAEEEIMKDFVEGEYDIGASFLPTFIEENWTKEDIFRYFSIPPESPYRKTGQYHVGRIFIRNSPPSRQLLSQVIEAVSDYHLVSDEPSNWPNAKGFEENRHDQSILSLVLKMKMEVGKRVITPHFGEFHFFKEKI